MFAQYDDIMTVEDLMGALNLGRSKVYELLRSKKIKSFKMKGYRIPKAALKNFVLYNLKWMRSVIKNQFEEYLKIMNQAATYSVAAYLFL